MMHSSENEIVKVGIGNVKRIVLVLSGKGGVGKSTITAQLAIGFWKKGFRVGVLDIDLCGPSIPRMLGLGDAKIHQCSEGWLPVIADSDADTTVGMGRLRVASMAFLLGEADTAVIWRGPRKSGLIKQLLESVCWGELDVLLVDTPPGTSDEHLTVLEELQRVAESRLAGAVVVTTPQRVSLCDVRRELGFCLKTHLPVLGIVENMSGYRCPHCANCANLFSSGGGQALAAEKELPFLGRFPIDPKLTALMDSSANFSEKAVVTDEMQNLVDQLLKKCTVEMAGS